MTETFDRNATPIFDQILYELDGSPEEHVAERLGTEFAKLERRARIAEEKLRIAFDEIARLHCSFVLRRPDDLQRFEQRINEVGK